MPISNSFAAGDTLVPVRKMVRRDDFVFRSEPCELWWKTDQIPLSPLELAVMDRLMIHGRTSYEALERSLSIGAKTRETLLHRIRRKADLAGAPNPIETIRAWGIKFRSDPTATAKCVWIGMNELNAARVEEAMAL